MSVAVSHVGAAAAIPPVESWRPPPPHALSGRGLAIVKRLSDAVSVRQVGDNRYSGSFYNSEYSISGVIHIVVRGASQSVRLISDSASATINLSR